MKKLNRCLAVILALVLLIPGSGVSSTVQAGEGPGNGQEITERAEMSELPETKTDNFEDEIPNTGEDTDSGNSDENNNPGNQEGDNQTSTEPPEEPEGGSQDQGTVQEKSETLEEPAGKDAQSLKDAGLLAMGAANGTFNAELGSELEVIYKPSEDAAEKYVDITGFKDAGLKISVDVQKDSTGYISSVTKISDGTRITFSDKVNTSVSFSFRLTAQIEDEKKFVEALDSGSSHITGLKVTEFASGAAKQMAYSDIQTAYTINVEKDLGQVNNMKMFLVTHAVDIDSTNGSGWLAKETEYVLENRKSNSRGLWKESDYISPRYIKNFRLEIPLPNNVTYKGSAYEGGKDGIKVSYDSGKRYVILEADSFYQRELRFTMTLDFTKVPTTGGISQYGLNAWHNFYSEYSGISGRTESGRPWKFSGQMYGVQQSATFLERSQILLDTELHDGNTLNSNSYTYSYPMQKIWFGDGIEAPSGSATRPSLTQSYSTSKNEKWNNDYTFNTVAEMDPAIRTQKVYLKLSDSLPRPLDVKITFIKNTGETSERTVTLFKYSSYYNSVSAPSCSAGEYIQKIIVENVPIDNHFFIYYEGELLTQDLNGNPLPVNTESSIQLYQGIKEYGNFLSSKSKVTAKYVELEEEGPLVRLGNDTLLSMNKEYNDLKLLSVSNNRTPTSSTELKELKDLQITSEPRSNDSSYEQNEIPLLYQMLVQSACTLSIKGYQTAPDIRIFYTTTDNVEHEILVPSSSLKLSGGAASAKVGFNLKPGELIKLLRYEISNLPVKGEVNFTIDKLKVSGDELPSGTKINSLPVVSDREGQGYIGKVSTFWISHSVKCNYLVPSGARKEKYPLGDTMGRLAWRMGLFSSRITYKESLAAARTPIYQGDETTYKFTIQDVAFNPTYAYEIDKQFNYMKGSFQCTTQNYKIIEEWIPNYFTDASDTEHYGNGLLRIRFIGSGEQGYNLSPVTKSNFIEPASNPSDQFELKVQAKVDANPGTYLILPYIYRSDVKEQTELKGNFLEVKNWNVWKDKLPETVGMSPLVVLGETFSFYDASRQQKDIYDIDGDGKRETIIQVDNRKNIASGSRPASPGEKQQITKLATTKVDGYLIDPESGNSVRNAKLYPHQEFEFVQLMEVVDTSDYTNFIGYYHIPKKDHKIVYADPDTGVEKEYISKFDTYLKDFLTTTVDGVDITGTNKIQVYYYVSDDPASLTDGHNNMNELKDDGSMDDASHYKTKAEIEAMVAGGMTKEEILDRVTMIKIKAPTVEAGKIIKSSTRLAVGHKGGDVGQLQDYFSGAYRYVLPSGTRIRTQYTPLMTFTLLDYDIQGSVWKDKDADSLLSPLETKMKGIKVELWSTGEDAHGGPSVAPYKIADAISEADGSFAFQQSYHGNFYLQFLIPDGTLLSLPKQQGGFAFEQSVFEKKTDVGTGETYARAYFTLDDKSYLYQNAGLVDERQLEVPEDIYISVGETADIAYQLAPDYLMYEDAYKITPTLQSDAGNAPYFTVGADAPNITGVSVGEGTITVSIPAAPLDGTTYITKTVTVHVEPASVASVSVPAKAEIYAVQGKTNEVIAPELTVYNYDPDPVKAYIKRIDINNTGAGKELKLVKKKDSYDRDEISLNVKPVQRRNQFSALAQTDLTQVEYIKGGLPLGTMEPFDGNPNWGKFTFDGEYNPDIVSTNLEDNRFVMSYRFEKAGTP